MTSKKVSALKRRKPVFCNFFIISGKIKTGILINTELRCISKIENAFI